MPPGEQPIRDLILKAGTTMSTRTITIRLTGQDDTAIEDAFDEATSRIKAGNTSGFDRNEESSFSFEVDPDEKGPLSRQFDAKQIEIALRALADLYDSTDGAEYLSERQQEVAELVRQANVDVDNPDTP
jgi:hypothetical protein